MSNWIFPILLSSLVASSMAFIVPQTNTQSPENPNLSSFLSNAFAGKVPDSVAEDLELLRNDPFQWLNKTLADAVKAEKAIIDFLNDFFGLPDAMLKLLKKLICNNTNENKDHPDSEPSMTPPTPSAPTDSEEVEEEPEIHTTEKVPIPVTTVTKSRNSKV